MQKVTNFAREEAMVRRPCPRGAAKKLTLSYLHQIGGDTLGRIYALRGDEHVGMHHFHLRRSDFI
jgi:hypothetical protein